MIQNKDEIAATTFSVFDFVLLALPSCEINKMIVNFLRTFRMNRINRIFITVCVIPVIVHKSFLSLAVLTSKVQVHIELSGEGWFVDLRYVHDGRDSQ